MENVSVALEVPLSVFVSQKQFNSFSMFTNHLYQIWVNSRHHVYQTFKIIMIKLPREQHKPFLPSFHLVQQGTDHPGPCTA